MARSTIDQQIEAQRKKLDDLQAKQEATRIKKIRDLNEKVGKLSDRRERINAEIGSLLDQITDLEGTFTEHPLDEVSLNEFDVDVPLPFSVVEDDTVEAKSSGTR